MQLTDQLKQQAAYRAVEEVRSGMILGLGTGSTTRFALERIAELLKQGQLKNILGIPSSLQTEAIARSLGIPLTSFDTHTEIDVTIDGADEVDPDLNLIKGGGGALLREKVLAQASRRNIIIVDEGKLSSRLGTRCALPVEVIPFAIGVERKFLQTLGAKVAVRKNSGGSPYRTDQGNAILDATFGPIADPAALAQQLNQRAGIVEQGLFLGLATEVIVAGKNGISQLKRQS